MGSGFRSLRSLGRNDEAARVAAEQIPGIAHDTQGPVFREPWEAQAFAMALALYDRGLFTWPEWAAILAEEIRRAQAAGVPAMPGIMRRSARPTALPSNSSPKIFGNLAHVPLTLTQSRSTSPCPNAGLPEFGKVGYIRFRLERSECARLAGCVLASKLTPGVCA